VNKSKVLVSSQLSVTDETKETQHDAWLSMSKIHEDGRDKTKWIKKKGCLVGEL